MSYLLFCCICMNKSDLKRMFDVDNDGISHYNKLTSSIAEMNFKEMNDQRLICGECCVALNTVYNFRQMCLRSKTSLIMYLSQLQTSSYVNTTSDPLKDVNSESIFVKEEIDIKCEKDYYDSNEDNISDFQTGSYEESVQFPASVKEECESDEDSCEDATVEQMDESACDVKVEVDETVMEEGNCTEFTKIEMDSVNDISVSEKPPETLQRISSSEQIVLPVKSKDKYENSYKRFLDFCEGEKFGKHTEEVVLAYFEHLSTTLKASTLWSYYSMLKATILTKGGVDISKYPKLTDFLKRKSHGFKSKPSKILNMKQINQFLYEAPDDTFLTTKVALIFGVAGACRCEELVQMKVKYIEDLGSKLLVKIPDGVSCQPRVFIVSEKYMDIYRKYVASRPSNFDSTRFFFKYAKGKSYRQLVGQHQIGRMPLNIATFLKLAKPEEYTGHCFRRSSNYLIDSGDF